MADQLVLKSMNDTNGTTNTANAVVEEEANTELESWLQAARSGSDAFDQIYDHFFPKIYNFIAYKVGDQEIAEDITSDTFMRVISKFDSFAGNSRAFTTWIYRIARNLITDYYRLSGRKTQVHYLPDDELALIGDTTGKDLEQSMDKNQQVARVRDAINKLKPHEQELITLRYFEGLDSKSIGEILDTKPATINVQLHRSVEKLKQFFEGSLQENNA